MRTHHLRKGAVACATVIGLLWVLATPASADTIAHMEITGGTWSAAGRILDLDPAGPQGPCAMPDPQLTIDFDPDVPGASGTWFLSGSFKAQFQLGATPGGPWYQSDVTILSAPGTWSHNSPSSSSGLSSSAPNHMVWQERIYELDPETCLKNNLKCVISSRVSITGTWSSASATLPDVVVGDSAVFNGTTLPPHLVVASCQAPFTSLHGQVGTLNGWSFTTVSTTP